jgi:branched-chain amino acid transport system permease protein
MTDETSADAGLRRQLESRGRSDLALVVGLLFAIYVGFAVIGVLLGYDINGIMNTLRRLTFLTAVYGMVVLALNLHWGYTGLFNIGVAGFMAVGAYTMAMATAPPDASIPGLGLPLWAGIILGTAAAAVVGLIAALPALRLRADYLAIVTIGISEIIRLTYLSSTLQKFTLFGVELGTGGGGGIGIEYNPSVEIVETLIGLPVVAQVYGIVTGVFESLGVVSNVVEGWVYALVLLFGVVAFFWLLERIGSSPFGRVLKAIREDEDVAEALGKNTRSFKIKVFMLGCGLMGLVGILWQGSLGFINPNTFMPQVTFFIWIALIIGGAGSNTGSVVGGALFAALLFEGPRYFANLVPLLLEQLGVELGPAPTTIGGAVDALFSLDPFPMIAYSLANINSLRLVLVGVVLIILMQNRPEGLLGHRKETAASIDLSRPRYASDGGSAAVAGADDARRGDSQ